MGSYPRIFAESMHSVAAVVGCWLPGIHMDLGCCVCELEGVGAAHHFHTHNVETLAGAQRDDPYTLNISWPNLHTGANGDFQKIRVVDDIHPVLQDSASPTQAIRYLPSHPHEGAISAPPGLNARVIAEGTSAVTGRTVNLAVAFEATPTGGRAIAQSTFHHFADYNWGSQLRGARVSSKNHPAMRSYACRRLAPLLSGMRGM
ncbi:MAG: hypothetical protein WDM77_09960 [Steroidobacteraceae bacterium]